ncbi:uncharacterized protein MYCGRDRAFT_96551 [Zymoseptoria tritici IPO323]|uniref:Ca2+-modulated nonselective cation channel polycystin n=1 Tax=Zymoseptoria tritici (strain CBS 115943 / IPO323) TaxID=336722 RepID=F9XMR7_ZYMTI|nr:uncharacterized protein MYCGRDRAFT_96551 [Zymoseptoria tritici IPO323]EGP83650.1 hypothetical protein MYCGRDRAFT_96551 [Zymoseptoria tritici IPO323]
MKSFVALALLAVADAYQSNTPVQCPRLRNAITAGGSQKAVTAFCSSYLSIKPKTAVLTSTISTITTITVAKTNGRKRDVRKSQPKPGCLNSYKPGPELSSACKCFSIQASTSTTRTTKVATSTSTITSGLVTSTLTKVAPLQTPGAFGLVAITEDTPSGEGSAGLPDVDFRAPADPLTQYALYSSRNRIFSLTETNELYTRGCGYGTVLATVPDNGTSNRVFYSEAAQKPAGYSNPTCSIALQKDSTCVMDFLPELVQRFQIHTNAFHSPDMRRGKPARRIRTDLRETSTTSARADPIWYGSRRLPKLRRQLYSAYRGNIEPHLPAKLRLTCQKRNSHAGSGTVVNSFNGTGLGNLSNAEEVEVFRLEEDSSSDDKDRFKSILPYKLEGWDKARLCNPNTAGSSKLQRRLAASLVIFPTTLKKRGREEDVNKTPEEQTVEQPGFPMYKGNVKSKKKRGNKEGEVIHRKGDVKYSKAIAHCKTIWNKAFP